MDSEVNISKLHSIQSNYKTGALPKSLNFFSSLLMSDPLQNQNSSSMVKTK